MSKPKINIKNKLEENAKKVEESKKGLKNPFGKGMDKAKKFDPSKKLKSLQKSNPFTKNVKKLKQSGKGLENKAQKLDPSKKLKSLQKNNAFTKKAKQLEKSGKGLGNKAKKVMPGASKKLDKFGNSRLGQEAKSRAKMKGKGILFNNPVVKNLRRAKNFNAKGFAKSEGRKKIAGYLRPIQTRMQMVKAFNPKKMFGVELRKKIGGNAFVKAKRNIEARTGMTLLDEGKALKKFQQLSPEKLKEDLKKNKKDIPQSRNLALIQERKKQKEKVKKGLKKSVKYALLACLLLVLAIALFFLLKPKEQIVVDNTPIDKPKFGVDFKEYNTETKFLQKEQSLNTSLQDLKLGAGEILAIEKEVIENEGFQSLEQGKKVYVLRGKEDDALTHFIYEHSDNQYMKLNFNEVEKVDVVTEALEIKVEEVGFIVESTLMETILEKGLRFDVIEKIEETLSSKIDLFRGVKPGDEFKLVYQQQSVGGEVVGTGNLLAISYKSISGKEVKGYYFEGQEYPFYDESGRPMKSSFLLAPVSIARITSNYGPRFHPVLQRAKDHLGTDYAAPEGTPIFSVADGEILKADFTEGNGNYVKVKHSETYTTQYLHMSKFADGMVPGRKVLQGETIGYVGSTGLATGPHVCFRFWKNGKQVNHLKEDLPQLQRLPFKETIKFDKLREEMNEALGNTIVY